MESPPRYICDVCGARIPAHAHYVVRIDVFADPSVPAMSTEELEELNFDQTFSDLLEQMKHMTADELQDQVARRFEYRLCRPCQIEYLADPLALQARGKA